MPRFAANLSVLFTDLPFLERFEAAQDAGFQAVEIAFPYEYCLFATTRKLRDTGLELALIHLPAGNLRLGDRGIAGHPLRQEEFRAGVETGIRWARELGVSRVNCLAGMRDERFSLIEQMEVLRQNYEYAAARLIKYGITLTIDAGNFCRDADRLLSSYQAAISVREKLQAANVCLLFQTCQVRAKADTRMLLRQQLRHIGYIRITQGCCQRQNRAPQPSLSYMLDAIDTLGYTGYVSLEDGRPAEAWAWEASSRRLSPSG